MLSFKLDKDFVNEFINIPVHFGFNGLGEVAAKRSYCRLKENDEKEEWVDVCERVVNGTYSIQKDYVKSHNLGWDEKKSQESAHEMFERVFDMKMLPPGRGLWSMGTPVVHEKQLSAALFNCAFVSTKDIDKQATRPFEFLMDMSMLGVGVGFDVKGAGKITIKNSQETFEYIIPDSREGWVHSVRVLLEHYLLGKATPVFNYDNIRPSGRPISTFGGISSGPEPLIKLHNRINTIFEGRVGDALSERDIVDIMNVIGVCVVSGGVRRTAEIALGPLDSDEFVGLKDAATNPFRNGFNEEGKYVDGQGWAWASNNSVYCELGDDYSKVAPMTASNGEPGYYFLSNARKYGRLIDGVNNEDYRVEGVNPCGEICLESYELCNIVETFPAKHDSIDDYLRTLKYAYMYAKTVTLMPSHWVETSRVQLRNRRIGISMSGITQAIEKFGIDMFREMCERGYEELKRLDKIYSEWLCVPESIKLTTVKPSGTVSLLAGATPGIHYPEAPYYIRRMRVNNNQTDIIESLEKVGYNMYPAPENPDHDIVVEFPVDSGCTRGIPDVTMWEKFELVAFMQTYWADNAVSCTINFDPETEGKDIEHALNMYQYKLKSVSLLPTLKGVYNAAPYEAISEEEYNDMVAKLNLEQIDVGNEDAMIEKYCDGDSCSVF